MSQFFTLACVPPHMCEGPLGRLLPAYVGLLSEQGYTQQSAHLQIRFLLDLNQWLHRQRLRIADIREPTLRRYTALF